MYIKREYVSPMKDRISGKANWDEHDVESGHGVTLDRGYKTYQVMSDIWEDGQYAVIWDETEGCVKTVDWVQSATVDATPEVIAKARQWAWQRRFDLRKGELTREAEFAARELVRGSMAKIIKGRKYPIGLVGKVVGFSDSQWGRKVGIAMSDVMVEVQKGNRTFQNHKDVAWTAISNVVRVDQPTIDVAAIEAKAKAAADGYLACMSWRHC